MQDIIARALALRNNSSSSGPSAELVQKVQKIEDEYVRAADEKDIEEISSSIEAIKQEIVDKGAEVKASIDSNSAIKAIQPLSEIANYGGKYVCTGSSEFARITSETKAEGIVFIAGVAKEGIIATTIQFWDSNKKTYNIAIKLYAVIHNDGSSLHVLSDAGNMRIDYNADGTFKAADTTNLYIGRGHVLDKYNTTEYTPTKDYHPATKKYVDDTIPSGGNSEVWELLIDEKDVEITETVQAIVLSLPSSKRLKKVRLYMILNRSNTDPITITGITINNVRVNLLMHSNRDKNIHTYVSAENDGFCTAMRVSTSVGLYSNLINVQAMLTASFNQDCDGKVNIPASFAGKYTIKMYGVYE